MNWWLCPKIQRSLEELKVAARNCEVTYAGNFIYEGRVGIKAFVVDLNRQTCTCRKWDVTGIPCTHAIGDILLNKRQPENFVRPFYYKEEYIRS
ncbi:hypothetical protein ACSBR2_016611 [Camellia fascicularis]